jgi:hypothetical protein
MKSVELGWDLGPAISQELIRERHSPRASECLSKVSYSISVLADG